MSTINEIFYTIQGESLKSGRPCIFIRFAGCNLKCSYCDTEYAREKINGKHVTVNKIIKSIRRYPCKYICITGGEPLLQKDVYKLATNLLNNNYEYLNFR